MHRQPSILAATLALVLVIAGGAVAAAPQTRKFSSGTVARSIPDPGTRVQKITVPRRGEIRDVNMQVRISHPHDADLTLLLQHPFGRTILLAGGVGGATGSHFGEGTPPGCSGTPTNFSDEAPTFITDGSASAPFAGSFRPQQPLSRFDGKQMQGTWRLLVTDDDGPGLEGKVHCATLRIRFRLPK